MWKSMKKRTDHVLKEKKGFTLVELIVVIVIILILAAVLVPSVMKNISRASQATCKQDAATILTQVQADVAWAQATSQQGVNYETVAAELSSEFSGITITYSEDGAASFSDKGSAKSVVFHVNENGVVDAFAYQDGTHFVNYSNGAWSEVDAEIANVPTTVSDVAG